MSEYLMQIFSYKEVDIFIDSMSFMEAHGFKTLLFSPAL